MRQCVGRRRGDVIIPYFVLDVGDGGGGGGEEDVFVHSCVFCFSIE